MISLKEYMHIAIDQAKSSLKEGNSGFGAVIVKAGEVIAQTHDTDSTDGDPVAHAEIKAIRTASSRLGKTLAGCILVSTHEPCPMCSTAAFWAGIETVAFGYSIKEAIKQGRRRIDLSIEEIFSRGGRHITIHRDVLHERCAVLYNKAVRDEIKALRNSDENRLRRLGNAMCHKRLQWAKHQPVSPSCTLDDAYALFLKKLGISPDEAPVVDRGKNRLVIHSKNFCPTLEACRILDLDTRIVCRHLTEKATTVLVRQLNPRFTFQRNYDKIRPYAPYCEEMIVMEP